MSDLILPLIYALIFSLVSVIGMCFAGKAIKLKREYTELVIPIIGALIFFLIFQNGFVSLAEQFGLVDNSDPEKNIIRPYTDIFISIFISQGIFIYCRKFGNKSSAVKRHWIFIGASFLLTVLFAAVAVIKMASAPVTELTKIIRDFLVKDAYILPNVFIVLLFIFILMIFDMILYKLTKEISFNIRRRKL